METPGEMHESLLRAMGVHGSSHTANILKSAEYMHGDRFILAWNLERCPIFSEWNGLSTHRDEQVQVRLGELRNPENEGTNQANVLAKAFMTLEHDTMLKIAAAGLTVVT